MLTGGFGCLPRLFGEGARLLGRAAQGLEFLPQLLRNRPQLFCCAPVRFVGYSKQFGLRPAPLGCIAAAIGLLTRTLRVFTILLGFDTI